MYEQVRPFQTQCTRSIRVNRKVQKGLSNQWAEVLFKGNLQSKKERLLKFSATASNHSPLDLSLDQRTTIHP